MRCESNGARFGREYNLEGRATPIFFDDPPGSTLLDRIAEGRAKRVLARRRLEDVEGDALRLNEIVEARTELERIDRELEQLERGSIPCG